MPDITVSRVKIAENLIEGVQYLSKRDVLAELIANNPSFSLSCASPQFQNSMIEWLKIEQVGVCHEHSAHQYYTAIQKALFSCHRPDMSQIIFMVHGDGEKVNLYLGIKQLDESSSLSGDDAFAENMSTYLNTLLPGSRTKYIQDLDNPGQRLLKDIKEKKYRHLYALTGIPSLTQKDGEEGLSSIDMLVGPLSGKKFVYYVVADPIDEYNINRTMVNCLELAGKIESVKTYNISETNNLSTTIGTNESLSDTVNESNSTAVNRKGKKHHFWCKVMSTIGLGDFIDQSTNTITKGLSHGTTHGTSQNETQGFSATSSMTIVNKCAEHAANNMSQHAKRYEKGLALGMWNVGVYLLTEDSYIAQNASMQLRSIVSGKDSILEPIRIHNISPLLNSKGTSSNLITSVSSFSSLPLRIKSSDNVQIMSNFSSLPENIMTCLTTEELTSYINLPQKSVPGISVVDYSFNFNLSPQNCKDKKDSINIGKLVYSGAESNIQISLPLNTLSRHALVCGVNGSGKTNTILSILDGFMKTNRPFFVIEPAKTEYVDWAIEYNKSIQDPEKKIKIYVPGCEKYSKGGFIPNKLRINPFEVINLPNSEMRVLSHIDRLKSTFASAFPMQDILPVIMEHLLYKLYTDSHQMLDKEDPLYMKKGFPTLATINAPFIDSLMSDIGYAQENTQNISAAMRTRFQSLKFGWKNELLNNKQIEGVTWDELFGSPVVINLSYAGDDQDRAFIMSILLQFLYEFRIAESESGMLSFNSNECRHLVVVEEAHRIMANCINTESPQYKSGLMFSNFLSEVRAYGQGMMVVDQVPTRLIEDAIKNTNIKIIHKLVAADDSQRISECIGLTPEQQKVIAKLSIGQAVLAGFNSANVASSDSGAVYLAQINKMK